MLINLFLKIPLDFSNVSQENLDWKNEVSLLYDFMVTFYKLRVNYDFNTEDPLAILENEEALTYVTEMINTILKSKLAEKYYLPAIEALVQNVLSGSELTKYKTYFNSEYIKTGLVDDINSLSKIYQIFKELELEKLFNEDSSYNLNLENEVTKTKFTTFINNLLNLKIIVGHESEIWMDLLNLSGLTEYITFDEPDQNTNWSLEKERLANIIVGMFDLKDIKDILGSTEDVNILEHQDVIMKIADLLDLMAESSLTQNAVFSMLDKVFEATGYHIELTIDDKEAIVDNTFQQEFTTLLELLEEANDLFRKDNGGNISLDANSSKTIVSLMKKASTSVIASKIVGEVLIDNFGKDGLNILPTDANNLPLYDFTNQRTLNDMADSIGVLIDLYVNLNNVDINNLSDNDIDNLQASLAQMGEEGINDELIGNFLGEMLKDENINISDNVNWQEESKALSDVLTKYQESTNKENFTIDDPELLEAVNNSDVAKSILEYLNIL